MVLTCLIILKDSNEQIHFFSDQKPKHFKSLPTPYPVKISLAHPSFTNGTIVTKMKSHNLFTNSFELYTLTQDKQFVLHVYT
jgi:hypothetical protein